MEGFLIREVGLRIVAHPEFFCPLSKSLLLSPVDLIIGDKQITVDRDSLETWFKTVGKEICPLSGASIRDWIIVKPNTGLKHRIREWARRQLLDLDAIEEAALKLRSKATHANGNGIGEPCSGQPDKLKMVQSCDAEWLLIDPISGESTSLAPGAFKGMREFVMAQQRSSSLPQQH
ncbi:probable U-box domain-containing protein 25 at N-terminal half [Coccomyxa sp. Obi]|nr:probable U-box domain-containing protein 25 at N-terminal half [Coccomyxa sp. Obi]